MGCERLARKEVLPFKTCEIYIIQYATTAVTMYFYSSKHPFEHSTLRFNIIHDAADSSCRLLLNDMTLYIASAGFNPFNPPAPPPAKPPAPEKKEPAKPPANTGPLRMMIFIGAGKEALLALPPNYAQAVKDATEKFEIPNKFHVRLAVKRGEEPSWLSKFVQQDFLFM